MQVPQGNPSRKATTLTTFKDIIMATNTNKKVMNLNDVLATLGISKSTLYRLIGAGQFPKPFKLGERLNAWRVETIEAWLNAQSANVEGGI
jgi:prophage regulatory protein